MLQLGIRGLGIARFKFNPISWFLKGEPGAWYDPSDLTTLFQDSAGTTPVTAVEQPVGLMLDKSKGLALGAELKQTGVTGLVGTLAAPATYNTTTGVGSVARVSFPAEQSYVTFTGLVPNSMYIIVFSAITGAVNLRYGVYDSGAWNVVSTAGAYYTITSPTGVITLTSSTNTSATFTLASLKQIAGNHAFQGDLTTGAAAKRPMLSARVNILLATATLSTQSVTSSATTYTLSFTGTGTVTLSGTAIGVLSAGTNTFTATAGTLTLTVSGSVTLADLRPTNSGALLPPYQRVTTASDYDTIGFPLYLKANGTSSAMSTNSVDFTSTDKMTVVTGVRKVVDQSNAVLMESALIMSSGNPGSFVIHSPLGTTANYTLGLIGVGAASAVTLISPLNYLAPISNVLSGLFDLGATTPNEIKLKVNGVFTGTQTGDAGSGNFGNYPLYLFARAGTSLFLNGQFYGAIIRGAQSDTASVTQTENYMATKTGITF